MERLTENIRNHDGSAVSKKSLVIEHGLKKGTPSAYCGAIVTKLADYEDIEEQGLLMRKVYIITDYCCKPTDCPWDCEVCGDDHLTVEEMVINYSDFDVTEHYPTKLQAEQALAEMQDK